MNIHKLLDHLHNARVIGKPYDLLDISAIPERSIPLPPIADCITISKTFDGKYLRNVDKIAAKMYKAFPAIKGEINENVLVAGGVLIKIILGYDCNCGDIDIFIIETDVAAATRRVEHLCKKIYDWCRYQGVDVTVSTSSNAITLKTMFATYQIIYRLYHHKYEIVLGFDIDSCCLIFDGKTVKLHKGALFAFTYGYNIFDTYRASPTYTHRLLSKYVYRGFGVIIPNINKRLFMKDVNYWPEIVVNLRRHGEKIFVNMSAKRWPNLFEDNRVIDFIHKKILKIRPAIGDLL